MTDANRRWPNLVTMFFEQAKKNGDKPFLWAKENKSYRPWTWREVADQVTALARGLRARGVRPGDRVVLVSENRPEWLIADVAIMAVGGITTPAYVTNTVADHIHVLENSGAVGAIVSTRKLAERLLPAAHQTADSRFVIAMEDPSLTQELSIEVLDWRTVLADGATGDDIAAEATAIKRTDTACMIYTSGTGGAPKGVLLAHGALLHNCEGARDALLELGLEHEVFLSFLPLSHSYEHTAGQFFPMTLGAEIYYAEGIEYLGRNLVEVRPTIMVSVPRLYEALKGRITTGIRKAGGRREKLFMRTLELGRKRYAQGKLGLFESLIDAVLDRLVRNTVRARFGGRMKAMVSGGAPLNPEVGLFFTALGLRILQGYGQTESGPVSNVNRPSAPTMDTVGPPILNTEVRIAEDGEILLRGELVMQGYWNDPQLTAETVRDGWLHTGDIGVVDTNGNLRITDRKKDIIVNSGGDNISPQRVEGLLTLEPEIAQAMVYGDRRPHLVGVIVPDPDWLESWAKERGLPTDLSALHDNPDLIAALSTVIETVNQRLSTIEKVRRFFIPQESFTIDNEMMTPTHKVRRHIVRKVYGSRLESLYG